MNSCFRIFKPAHSEQYVIPMSDAAHGDGCASLCWLPEGGKKVNQNVKNCNFKCVFSSDHSVILAGMTGKGIKCYDMRLEGGSVATGGITDTSTTPSSIRLANNSTKFVHGVSVDPFDSNKLASYGENTVRERN